MLWAGCVVGQESCKACHEEALGLLEEDLWSPRRWEADDISTGGGGIDRAPCHLLSAGGPGTLSPLPREITLPSLCQFPLKTGFTWVSQSVHAFLVFICGGKKDYILLPIACF